MKKEYLSPEFDFKEVFFVRDVLGDSRQESTGDGGNDPDPYNPFNPTGATEEF